MRKFYFFTLLFGMALFLSSNLIYSQSSTDSTKTETTISDTTHATGEIGKIFTKEEADSLFGAVLKVDTIKTDELIKLTKLTPNYVMFNLVEGKALVLNDKKDIIFNNANTAISKLPSITKPEMQFHLLSTSKVLELIKAGGSDVTTIETREKHLTLTNGSAVLEQSMFCPPVCP